MTVLVSPGISEARAEIEAGIESRKLVIMVAACSVTYSGRAGSQLGEGDRLIILKKDGCALVHRGQDYHPVNWQPSGCVIKASIIDGTLVVKAVRPSPLESLIVTARQVQFLGTFQLDDKAEFQMHASEEDMQRAIILEPEIVEPGFKIVDFEKKVPPGFVDVYGVDSEGNTVVIEIKKDPAGFPALKQLLEYLKYLEPASGKKLRPFIVAPSLAKGVHPHLSKNGIEHRQLTLQKSAEIIRKHSRSDQKALRNWLSAG
jgi:endonuclease